MRTCALRSSADDASSASTVAGASPVNSVRNAKTTGTEGCGVDRRGVLGRLGSLAVFAFYPVAAGSGKVGAKSAFWDSLVSAGRSLSLERPPVR